MKKRIYPPKLIKGVLIWGLKLSEWAILIVGILMSLAFMLYAKVFSFRVFVPISIYGICSLRVDDEENIFFQLKLMLYFLLDQQKYKSETFIEIHESNEKKKGVTNGSKKGKAWFKRK